MHHIFYPLSPLIRGANFSVWLSFFIIISFDFYKLFGLDVTCRDLISLLDVFLDVNVFSHPSESTYWFDIFSWINEATVGSFFPHCIYMCKAICKIWTILQSSLTKHVLVPYTIFAFVYMFPTAVTAYMALWLVILGIMCHLKRLPHSYFQAFLLS